MKFKNNERGVLLHIEENLIKKIGSIGIRHYPNEFGGFLMGKYSGDLKTLYIQEVILPNSYKGSKFLFERSTDGLEESFKKLFSEKGIYYVGEWHTHPNGSTHYSQTDLDSMIEIYNCKTVNIINPVLFILSIDKKKINHSTFYLYNNEKLIPYEQ